MRSVNEKIGSLYKKRKLKQVYNVCVSFLCILTALGVVGGLIKPAISETKKADGSYTANEVQLLVGDNNDIKGETVAETIEKANDKYLLGIASQFSVFLEKNFISIASDCEGRLAVGGNVDTKGYNYNVGMGNYESPYESLETILNNNNFAHAIVNGNTNGVLYIPWDNQLYGENNGGYNEGRPRTIVVGGGAYDNQHQGLEKWQYYVSDPPIIDFESTFEMLNMRSKILANSVKEFADGNPEKNEEATTVTVNGDKVTFDGKNRLKNNTVMFNMPNWVNTTNMVEFNFINIPNGANIVINCDDESLGFPNAGFSTSISTGSTINAGDYISKDKTGLNNKEGCARLLWNFSKATSICLGGDFQGTILAPNADVTDNFYKDNPNRIDRNANGHLSGALIAKSFAGTTEFGYRSYQGPMDMLELPNKYYINVDKLDGAGSPLSNATIVMKQKDTNDEWQDYQTWESDGTSHKVEVKPGVEYKIYEESAPDGYIKSDKEYHVTVTEKDAVKKDIAIGGGYKETPYSINSIGWQDSNFNNYSQIKMRFTYKDDQGKFVTKEIDLKNITKHDDYWWDINERADIPEEFYKVEICTQKSNESGYNPKLYINGDGVYIWNTTGEWKVFNKLDLSIPVSSIPVNCINEVDVNIDGTTKNVNFDNEIKLELDSDYNLKDPEITLTDKDASTTKPDNPTFTNTKGTGITLQKVDTDGTTLSGAEIELYAENNDKIATFSNLGSANLENGTPTSNFTDYVYGDNKLKPGKYYLKETTAPDGYKLDSATHSFTVKDTGEVVLPEGSKLEKTENKTGDKVTGYTIKFKNTPIPKGKMVVKKEWYKSDGTTIDGTKNDDIIVKVYRTTNEPTNNLVTKPAEGEEPYATITLKKAEDYTKVLYPETTDSNGNKYYYYVVEDVPERYTDSYEVRQCATGKTDISDGYKSTDDKSTYTYKTGKYVAYSLIDYSGMEDLDVNNQNKNKPTKFIIKNTADKPIEMPATGGVGTTRFFAVGSALTLVGSAYAIVKKKKKS